MELVASSQIVFAFLVVIFSIIVHEVAHGYAAYIQGDETAYRAGRLTLNPLPHIDLIGSIIVPLLALFGFGTLFGWAKPVPYNPYNIRTKIGQAFVAAAGVLANIILVVFTVVMYKVVGLASGLFSLTMKDALITIMEVNLSLAFFNLIPVPPFDGMSIIQSLFPRLHVKSAIVYSPLYLIVAIIVASVLYQQFMPHIFAWFIAFLG